MSVALALPGVMAPRPYQLEAIERNALAFQKHRAVLDVMATGVGKSVLAAHEAARCSGSTLFLAHRDALIRQAAQKLRHVTQMPVGIEKADEYASPSSVCVAASVQTLRGQRLESFAKAWAPKVELIVWDEVHGILTKERLAILAAFPEARILGLTATADRSDGKSLGAVFKAVGYRYDIVNATADAWLTPGSWMPLPLSGVSLDSVGLKGGDIDQGALDVETVKLAAEIALGVIQNAKGRRSLIFTPGVRTAEAGAAALNARIPGCARYIHGGMKDEERDAIEKGHKSGEFPYLLNCQIYLEGYDDPEIICIFDFAKTKSRLRWAQKYGRGTRLWPRGVDHLGSISERRSAIACSPKSRMYFFDALYGSHAHDLAGPTDLLGGTYPEEVRKTARAILEEKGGGDVQEALTEAKERLDERARTIAAISAAAAKAKGDALALAARPDSELYGQKPKTPFELLGMRDPENNPWLKNQPQGQASPKMLGWLRWKKVPVPEGGMSAKRARSLMLELRKRESQGKASYEQLAALERKGVTGGKSLGYEAALRMLEGRKPRTEVAREPGQEG